MTYLTLDFLVEYSNFSSFSHSISVLSMSSVSSWQDSLTSSIDFEFKELELDFDLRQN